MEGNREPMTESQELYPLVDAEHQERGGEQRCRRT